MQLINSIYNDLQKLSKYFNGTTIFVFFTELFILLTTPVVFPTSAALYLIDLELPILKSALLAGTSLFLNCHILPALSE